MNTVKYYIPIFGWIVAMREWNLALKVYLVDPTPVNLGLTCSTFRNTNKGFVVTFIALWLLMVAIDLIFFLTK